MDHYRGSEGASLYPPSHVNTPLVSSNYVNSYWPKRTKHLSDTQTVELTFGCDLGHDNDMSVFSVMYQNHKRRTVHKSFYLILFARYRSVFTGRFKFEYIGLTARRHFGTLKAHKHTRVSYTTSFPRWFWLPQRRFPNRVSSLCRSFVADFFD